MNTVEMLDELQNKALHDEELKNKFLKTKEEEDSLGAFCRVCRELGYEGGLEAVISVPEGEALAAKTFNPRLGILGGISILGTSGIVRPMSEAALIDSLYLEQDIAKAAGVTDLLVTPGNYGESFAREVLGLNLDRWCMCSNYLGAAIDHAAGAGFRCMLLYSLWGKNASEQAIQLGRESEALQKL